MNRAWAVTPTKIRAAVDRVVQVAHPRRVILFGSAARGRTRTPNDVDLLIISGRAVQNRRKESVRIRRALRGITMKTVPGTIFPRWQWQRRKVIRQEWQRRVEDEGPGCGTSAGGSRGRFSQC